MTVAQLIKELQKYPLDISVEVRDSEFGNQEIFEVQPNYKDEHNTVYLVVLS